MFSADDTIVAIATPPGRGALGVVRISGSQARQVAGALLPPGLVLRPRYATLTTMTAGAEPAGSDEHPARSQVGSASTVRDQVVVTLFPGPHSGTGEDVVEITAHGSPVVLNAVVQAAVQAGARLARPGEFSLRGYLHGKIDLAQAEAVRDLVDAQTPAQAAAAGQQLAGGLSDFIRASEEEVFDLMARLEASLDFPDEGFHFLDSSEAATRVRQLRARLQERLAGARRGRLLREGLRVAIVGAPNAGKSSLFNALLQEQRAIVSIEPGTTRDLLTESLDLRGYLVRLTDTAGLREAESEPEREGIRRAAAAGREADLRLVVIDGSQPATERTRAVLDETATSVRIVVVNKCDFTPAHGLDLGSEPHVAWVCARSGDGVAGLADQVLRVGLDGTSDREPVGVTDARHIQLLEAALQALGNGERALDDGASEEFVLADLHRAAASLQEVTGERSDDALLQHVFASFCLGK